MQQQYVGCRSSKDFVKRWAPPCRPAPSNLVLSKWRSSDRNSSRIDIKLPACSFSERAARWNELGYLGLAKCPDIIRM